MEQRVIDQIKSLLTRHLENVDRQTSQNGPALKLLLTDVASAFTGEQPFNDGLINRIRNEDGYELYNFIEKVFGRSSEHWVNYLWPMDSPVVQKLVQRRHLTGNQQRDGLSHHIMSYVFQLFTHESSGDLKTIVDFLHRQGFSDEDLAVLCVTSGAPFYASHMYQHYGGPVAKDDQQLTKFGQFIVPLLKPSGGFLGFGKSSGIKKTIDKIIFHGSNNEDTRTSWLKLLLQHYPDGVEELSDFLFHKTYQSNLTVNVGTVFMLLDHDAARYDQHIMAALDKGTLDEGNRFMILLALNSALKGKYRQALIHAGEKHLHYFTQTNQPGSYYYEPRVQRKTLSAAYFDFLEEENPEQLKNRIDKFFLESRFLSHDHFNYVDRKFGAAALPWLIEGLKKDPENLPGSETSSYYETLFAALKKYDLRPYQEVLQDFAVNRAGKNPRVLAAGALAGIGPAIIPDATTLLTGKTVDHRVTGALTLAALETPEADTALNNAVDKESNDDTRDIMLGALSEKRFKDPYTLQQVREMIAVAAQRKKLAKWNEKWIDETKLPQLYWADGQPLAEHDIRFLFYRMKRAPGLNSDIEARQTLNHIDRSKSQPFAKALVTAFQDSNADTKLKYYLTLAALLGDDEMMHNLNTLFKKSITDKRIKMAEYVVGALAMVGTDKALRLVEVIYRKFATKKPSVSQAAKAALDAAATELNITMDELSDRIIPNFDFDGLYKKVTVDGDEYRAFISADFKLNYFTEDNKVRKSLPASAPKELKAEFKEIEKELNDVIKSQSGRLEKYMIEERRWSVENWKTFFFNNPIMFVYALKLLWGIFDKDGKLLGTFYCSEDTSLYDVNDEEVAPEDDRYIGILHPAHLSSSQLGAWKDKVYNLSMVTIFPILDRPVFNISDDEKNGSASKAFFNKDIPKGADFVNTFLVKQNWHKSTGDGGRTEFSKPYKDGVIKAIANIDGPTAWYQGGEAPAKMYEVVFIGKNWQDQVLLKDVPVIFYSEVMSDLQQMINA